MKGHAIYPSCPRLSTANQDRQRGFTLMELVISILVLGILGATAAYGIQNGVIAFQVTQDALDSLGKLRYATERLTRELREVRRDPLDSSRYDIATLGAGNIEFVKQDGTEVSVAVSGGTLTLEYDSPAGPHVLTDRLSAFSLAYYDADGNSTADAATVAFIELEVVLSDGSGSLPQRGRVALRSQP
jgi:MSHA biogenesis protein MshO